MIDQSFKAGRESTSNGAILIIADDGGERVYYVCELADGTGAHIPEWMADPAARDLSLNDLPRVTTDALAELAGLIRCLGAATHAAARRTDEEARQPVPTSTPDPQDCSVPAAARHEGAQGGAGRSSADGCGTTAGGSR